MCIPQTEECNGYKPDNGNWRFYINLDIKNSGIRDITRNIDIHLSLSNPKMSFKSHNYSNFTVSSRRNLAVTSLTISKSFFTAREEEIISFESLIDYQTNRGDQESGESIGKIEVTMTYFGRTVPVKELNFDTYDVYSTTLSKYYKSEINWLAILFVLWLILHGIFIFLQIKFNITEIILKKFQQRNEEKEQKLPTISEHIVNEVNLHGKVEDLKESLTVSRSNADFLPKLLTNDVSSLRSSKDREMFKEEDSGEI